MKKLFLVALPFLFSLSMADVHPGLKSAVDSKDLKKAEALIKNFGIEDIYCPASMTVAEANKLYGSRFSADPNLVFENCDEKFIENNAGQFCGSKQGVPLCRSLLQHTAVEKWAPFLAQIKKNKLHKETRSMEVQEMVPQKISTSQCMANLNKEIAIANAFLKDVYKENCGPRGSALACKLFYEPIKKKSDETISAAKTNCKKNPTEKVLKRVNKKTDVNPFQQEFSSLAVYVQEAVSKTMAFDENDATLLENLREMGYDKNYLASEDTGIKNIVQEYSTTGDVSDKNIVKWCRLYPQIDKHIEKSTKVALFSCAKTLKKYSEKCSDSKMISIPNSENGSKLSYYVCENKAWHEAGVAEYNTYGQKCDKNSAWKLVNGSVDKNSKFYCDEKKWVRTVKTGNILWMGENLNRNLKGSMCYGDKQENCDIYGRLYNQHIAKKACPSGWRLPTSSEWDSMEEWVKATFYQEEEGSINIDDDFLDSLGWGFNFDNRIGRDLFGFSVLPAGYEMGGYEERNFSSLGETAFFWLAEDFSFAYFHFYMGFLEAMGNPDNSYSVRCVKE